jgi:N-acylneuraminate cytidylyltransferase/CMP-N,N'-diacetyllegionaminic acid synthase
LNIVGLVPARGGSKTIPRKNIRLLAGKPLIAWTIDAAINCHELSHVIVSTDDPEIAEVALQWGAEVPFLRPAELAGDETSTLSVVLHLIHWLEDQSLPAPEYVLLLQPTSPFRTLEDVKAVIDLTKTRKANAVVSVCEAKTHPFLCKRIQEDGTLSGFTTADIDYLRRQDLPPAYVLNGAIYMNSRESLLEERTFIPKETLAYLMPPERSLDLDTLWDWHLAELILRDKREA